MSRGMVKAERLRDIERVLLQYPHTIEELVAKYGVTRSTIYRNLNDLKLEVPLKTDSEGRYFIDKTRYISAVRLNLHEALALYLAARRLFRQTKVSHPHIAAGLSKLATALHQPMTERLVEAAKVVEHAPHDAGKVKVLERLARCWAEGVQARIRYRRLHGRKTYTYMVSPYLIEPTIWGDGTYLIGYSDYHNDVATFKVERIESATVTTVKYEIPDEFDEQKLFAHAWGIWRGEGEPITVKLRFSAHVTERVKESIWHPSQKVEDEEDGGCVWSAQVGEWREMLPWVRGWGADCEVLEPPKLRDELRGEARRLAVIYGWETHRAFQYPTDGSRSPHLTAVQGSDSTPSGPFQQTESAEGDKHRFFDDFFGD